MFYILDADQEKAVWGLSNAPDEEVQALLFPQGVEVRTFPWLIINSPFHIADAPQAYLTAPVVELISDRGSSDIRTIHLRFTSQREATILYAKVTNPDLIFHSVTVNRITSAIPLNQNQLDVDKLILPEGISLSDEFQNRTLFYFEGLGAGEWVDVFIEVGAGESVDLIVLDSSFGLPSFSEELLDLLRPSSQPGHAETIVYTAVSFGNGK